MGDNFVEGHHKDFQALRGKKYSPDQPRVPSGSSQGGQWTSGGGGGSRQDAFSSMPDKISAGGLEFTKVVTIDKQDVSYGAFTKDGYELVTIQEQNGKWNGRYYPPGSGPRRLSTNGGLYDTAQRAIDELLKKHQELTT